MGEPSKGAGQGEKEGEDEEKDEQYHRDVVHRPDEDDGDGEYDAEDEVDGEGRRRNIRGMLFADIMRMMVKMMKRMRYAVSLPGGRFRFLWSALAVYLI